MSDSTGAPSGTVPAPQAQEAAGAPGESAGSAKKMKQTRIPFAPIKKDACHANRPDALMAHRADAKVTKDARDVEAVAEAFSPSSAKRKRPLGGGEGDDGAPNKVVVAEGAGSPKVQTAENRTTPRRIQPTFLGKTGSVKKDRRAAPARCEAKGTALDSYQTSKDFEAKPNFEGTSTRAPFPETDTPTVTNVLPVAISPLRKEEIKFKLKVAAAKVSVAINELNHAMEKAADDKNFLKAAEIKQELDRKRAEKASLEDVMKTDDPQRLSEAVNVITCASKVTSNSSTPSRDSDIQVRTPDSSVKKRRASNVSTPGSAAKSDPPFENHPDSSGKKPKKLTPKGEMKLEEQRRRREERDRAKEEARLEKEKKREEERKQREEAKLQKEREKDRVRKEKEALKEAERVEKEEQKRRKEEEKEQEKKLKAEAKAAEMQRKQEERDRKHEEKERQIEEKRRQEELEKLKAIKEANTFKSFFVKKATSVVSEEKKNDEQRTNSNFTNFRVKKDMRMAPIMRKMLPKDRRSDLDALIVSSAKTITDHDCLYLTLLKEKRLTPGKSGKTWPVEDARNEFEDDDIEILDEDDLEGDDFADGSCGKIVETVEDGIDRKAAKKMRAKLLQFSENERPPYWGTWTKSSGKVNGRRPFSKDENFLDYDYDSGDDWEEEEQGESLSDEEKDKEEEDEQEDDDDDDGFFVGHGVLDKDEVNREDSEDECGEVVYDEELEQKKQRIKAEEFEQQYRQKKPAKLKQKIWCSLETSGAVLDQLLKILKPFAAVNLTEDDGDGGFPSPIATMLSNPKPSPVENTPGVGDAANGTPTPGSISAKTKREKIEFPEDCMKDLIRLVHANTNNKAFMIDEFTAFLNKNKFSKTATYDESEDEKPITGPAPGHDTPKSAVDVRCDVPKRKIKERILEIADYKRFEKEGPMLGKTCWVVKECVLEEHNMSHNVRIPNEWEYILDKPKRTTTVAAPTSTGTPKRTVGENSASAKTPDQASSSGGSEPRKEKKRVSIQTLFLSMSKRKDTEAANTRTSTGDE